MGPIDPDLPIVDHHCHLSPDGEGVAAAGRFRAAGGTHLFLCTQGYGANPPNTLEGYRSQFETTEALGRRVRADTGVQVYVVLAPFPVDLVSQVPALGRAAAVDLHRQALELAGRWIREARGVALGEVGRPHFPIDDQVRQAVDETFRSALDIARDVGCPLVVHSEDLDPEGFRGLAAAAEQAGVPARHVIKHYARKRVDPADRAGIAASYVAKRETFDQVLGDGPTFFFETDFLDDPRRPGAVLDLATIPRRARAALAGGPAVRERLRGPFVESIRLVYGFAPRLEGGVPA